MGLVALSLLLLSGACSASDGDIDEGELAHIDISTPAGPIRGRRLGEVVEFLGIPYAEPPVGALRWRSPVPASPWAERFDAREPGPRCPQKDTFTGEIAVDTSEDCLSINVWTADVSPDALRPVMVWIHGGAFETGSGYEDGSYSGQNLASDGSVVVVTLNYRLGPLGLLYHEELVEDEGANYALQDQLLALEWVQENIEAFGGDPDAVTIFGESAGGMFVNTHLVMEASRGLFHRAIVQSGPSSQASRELDQAATEGAQFAQALGCDAGTIATCLREQSVEALLEGAPTLGLFAPAWSPVVDGSLLEKSVTELLADGRSADVPVMVGSNADEGTLFLAAAGIDPGIDESQYSEIFAPLVAAVGADLDAVDPLYDVDGFGSWYGALAKAYGHAVFNCQTRRDARAIASVAPATYLYYFTQQNESVVLGNLGATHTAEIPFVFGNPYLGMSLDSEADRALSETMMNYWVSFASSGEVQGAPEWPAYRTDDREYIELGTEILTQSQLLPEFCDAWDTVPM